MTTRPAIADYAIIGDCRTAALVSRLGSIDWLCWPRFDSPSLFGALLDDDGGDWYIRPTAPFEACRTYVDATNVLQTTFHAATGRVVVTDLMPVASEHDKRQLLLPDHEILRIVTCQSGAVELEQRFAPRPGYGSFDHTRERSIITLATRLGGILVILFMVQLLVSIYRYVMRLAFYYDARADSIELAACIEDVNAISELIKLMSPDGLELGASPKSPVEHLTDVAKAAAGAMGDKVSSGAGK